MVEKRVVGWSVAWSVAWLCVLNGDCTDWWWKFPSRICARESNVAQLREARRFANLGCAEMWVMVVTFLVVDFVIFDNGQSDLVI